MAHQMAVSAALALVCTGVTRAAAVQEEVPTCEAQWLQEAKDGAREAQYFSGLCALFGETGVSRDAQAAVAWFRRSAEQGLPRAQYALGLCLQEGVGIEKNEEEATVWFRRAAEQG